MSFSEMLFRNESKVFVCKHKGNEKECNKVCEKCAVHIKENADHMLRENKKNEALTLYKKAAFIEPYYADAWVCIGKIYVENGDYDKALSAFDKALAIDFSYGDAIYNKAIVLKNLGRLDEAINILNDLLALSYNDNVIELKEQLIKMGGKDHFELDAAIEIMTSKALEVATQNDLLDKDGKVITEKAICERDEFSKSIFQYCQKNYVLLGEEKVHSESIVTSFYASLCTTLLYYKDRNGFFNVSPFEYLIDYVDLEKVENAAERMLGIKFGDEDAEALWNMIYEYSQFACDIISKVDDLDREMATLDATESAYMLGMMYAMRYNRERTFDNRKNLDLALEKLAESSKEYVNPPKESAMCYSISLPDEVEIQYQCDKCGKIHSLKVWEGEENLIDNYGKLTSKFAELGHKTAVLCFCDDCATSLFPSNSQWSIHNIVFSFLMDGLNTPSNSSTSNMPVYSFPSTHRYSDFEYEVALCFLKGADTIEKLAEATGTRLDAEKYLQHIKNVIG